MTDALQRLKAAAGEGGWTDDAARIAPKLTEWRGRWTGETPLLLLPRTAAEVARLVRVCAETATPVTIQGGNTGLVGGQIPRGEVLLSLERLRTIREVSAADGNSQPSQSRVAPSFSELVRPSVRRARLSQALLILRRPTEVTTCSSNRMIREAGPGRKLDQGYATSPLRQNKTGRVRERCSPFDG